MAARPHGTQKSHLVLCSAWDTMALLYAGRMDSEQVEPGTRIGGRTSTKPAVTGRTGEQLLLCSVTSWNRDRKLLGRPEESMESHWRSRNVLSVHEECQVPGEL